MHKIYIKQLFILCSLIMSPGFVLAHDMGAHQGVVTHIIHELTHVINEYGLVLGLLAWVVVGLYITTKNQHDN